MCRTKMNEIYPLSRQICEKSLSCADVNNNERGLLQSNREALHGSANVDRSQM